MLRAGDIQLAHLGRTLEVTKKGAIDLVTEVDLAVERMFRDLVAERFPDHQVVAEELGGERGAARAPYCWVFDPLDGTTNYAHGLPLFCSSLALEIEGQLAVGAIYDPTRRELFTATDGGGAYLNGSPLSVSSCQTLIDGLLVTGFSYQVQEEASHLVDLFRLFLQKTQAVRRLGSAALDLCYVAAGRFDGFWEQGLKPWDMAAGALIVREAGGTVTGMDGSRFRLDEGHILAATPGLHDAMRRVIADWETASPTRGT